MELRVRLGLRKLGTSCAPASLVRSLGRFGEKLAFDDVPRRARGLKFRRVLKLRILGNAEQMVRYGLVGKRFGPRRTGDHEFAIGSAHVNVLGIPRVLMHDDLFALANPRTQRR